VFATPLAKRHSPQGDEWPRGGEWVGQSPQAGFAAGQGRTPHQGTTAIPLGNSPLSVKLL